MVRDGAVVLLAALACLFVGQAQGGMAESVATDWRGRVRAIYVQGEPFDVTTSVRLALAGWKKVRGQENARDVRAWREGAAQHWSGGIELAPGKRFRFEQTLERLPRGAKLALRVSAEADVAIEGAFFWLDVPITLYAGGQCEIRRGKRLVAQGKMPERQPKDRHFLSATGDELVLRAPEEKATLRLRLDRPCSIVVQDTREWKGTVYSAFIKFAGQLARGKSAELVATLQLDAQVDRAPAKLSLDPSKVRYILQGFGGNFCYRIESPVTQYVLNNLTVRWARTQMSLDRWEPENDNASPEEANWDYFRAQDKPGSALRREFLLAKEIQARGIPYCISIWRLPEWLYAEPGKGPQAPRRRVPQEKWPELLECIGSYLLYAKRQYGVEPDLFSFNEANIGVRVLLSPEEHRDAIKRIGAHLEKLGLKTKMLLADVNQPRGTEEYALPAAQDPEAMRYVGALAFHSWNGATPAQYAAWPKLARKLGLPLLVTELGVDPSAWRTRAFDSFLYGMREVQMYQEILLYACPQGTMHWEFTADYGVVREVKDAAGRTTCEPTARFWLLKHFCDLTPTPANALATTSSSAKVLFTAFSSAEGKRRFALHIANVGAGRKATISGLPAEVSALRAVRTTEGEHFAQLGRVPVRDGVAEVELAPLSLLTLLWP